MTVQTSNSQRAEYILLSDNSETRVYFDRFVHISKMLQKISEREMVENGKDIDDYIVLGHLNKLNNTLTALRMKYWFNGLVQSRQKSKLMLDVIDSGFPTCKEIQELMVDKSKAEQRYTELDSEEDIKRKIMDYALSHKKVPIDLQYDLALKQYYSLLIQNDLFLANNNPKLISQTDPKFGKKRRVMHWSVYDVQKNIPQVYIMVFDYSGEGELEENPRLLEALTQALTKDSISTLKLISIAKRLDTDFEHIHPKSLKRVHVGPVYTNGLTHHNDHVQSVLDNVTDTKDNWVFAWSTETLVSKDTQTVSKGLFGKQQKEQVFEVDSYCVEAFEAGATEVEKNMIIPYEAYQALTDAEHNPLNSINKFVVNNEGHVIYL